MIKKSISSFLRASINFGGRQYFGSHGPPPENLKRVEDNAIKLNVKNPHGQWEEILAFEGESFYEALSRMKIAGLNQVQMCNGGDLTYRPHERPHDPLSNGPTCGECRIILKDNWFDKIMEETDGMTHYEQMRLLKHSDIRKDVRLACCIPVQKWMSGCTFQILSTPELSELTKFY